MSKDLLARTLRRRPHHLSAFFVLGDPTPEQSHRIIDAAVEAGATMLELGLPYNSPCADGTAIQAASRRALNSGASTDSALEAVARLRATHPELPLNLLVYANLVHSRGVERFVTTFAAAGASSLLVPDVLLEEGDSLRDACRAAGMASVQLVGPNTSSERMRAIDRECDGFLYLAAVQGVTGSLALDPELQDAATRRVRAACSNPLCVGFGLRDAGDVARVFANGAQIAVVGSAFARAIADAMQDGRDPAEAVATKCLEFIGSPHPS